MSESDLDRKKAKTVILGLGIFVPMVVVGFMWYNRTHPYMFQIEKAPMVSYKTPDGFYIPPPIVPGHFEQQPKGSIWIPETPEPTLGTLPDNVKTYADVRFTKDGHAVAHMISSITDKYSHDIIWRQGDKWYGLLAKDKDIAHAVDSSLDRDLDDCYQCKPVIVVNK